MGCFRRTCHSYSRLDRKLHRGHILAEIRIFDGESIESALRRFKRQVQQDGIIKELKRHSFFLKPGEKKRLKSKLAHKLRRKKERRQPTDSDSKESPRSQWPHSQPRAESSLRA